MIARRAFLLRIREQKRGSMRRFGNFKHALLPRSNFLPIKRFRQTEISERNLIEKARTAHRLMRLGIDKSRSTLGHVLRSSGRLFDWASV